MILTQRGVLPPVNFLELDATLRSSILGPSGTRTILQADLAAALFGTNTFTPTWTGFSANPVGDLTWMRFAGFVFLFNNTAGAVTGTSNAVDMTITNIPVAITPLSTRTMLCNVTDGGNTMQGWGSLSAANVLTFGMANSTSVANRVQLATGNFAAAGVKGLPVGWVMSWVVT
jgi:hypothetical protein